MAAYRSGLYGGQIDFSPLTSVSGEGPRRDAGLVPIRVASRERAVEFSLVLVSQGMEPELHPDLHGPGAELRVPADQLGLAHAAIQKYQEENRRTRWRSRTTHGRIVYDWHCIGWALLTSVLYFLQTQPGSPMRARGALDSAAYASGEFWRAVTATGLHADLRHLSSNLTIGLVFLGLAMAEYGTGAALLASTVAGALANMAVAAIRHEPFIGLGASGVVMASLGLLAVRAFHPREWRCAPGLAAFRGLLSGVFLLILFGLNPDSDVPVHVMGFGIGAVLGLLLGPMADRFRLRPAWDVGAVGLFLILVSGSWWWALK